MTTRSLVLATIVVLLVASCARAAPLSSLLMPMVKHGNPICVTEDFNTSATTLFGICLTVATNVGTLLKSRDITPTELASQFETACESPCAKAMLAFSSDYHKCIHDDVLSVSFSLTKGCERDPVSNARCIVDMTMQMASHMMCDFNMQTYRPWNETSCKLMPQCQWSDGDNYNYCKFNARAAIPSFCESFCARKFMAAELPPSLKMQMDETCLKVEGQYCGVVDLRRDMFEGDDQDIMMCSSRVQYECTKRTSEMSAAARLYRAVMAVPSCLENRVSGRTDTTPTDYDMMICASSIPQYAHGESTAGSSYEHKCARNAQGKLCGVVAKELVRRYENDPCLELEATQLYDTSCANCHANISRFLNELGCCTGSIASETGSKLGPRVEMDRVLMRFMTSDPNGEFVVKPTGGPTISGSTIYISGIGSLSLGALLGSLSLGGLLGSGVTIGTGSGETSIPTNAPPRPSSNCYTTGCKMYWNGREYIDTNRYNPFRAFDECTGVDMQAKMMQTCAVPAITPISACFSETFIVALEDAQIKCDQDMQAFGELSQMTAAMFNSFCSSSCMTAIELISKSPHCLGSDMLEGVSTMKAMCTKDDSNNYCGLHLAVMEISKCDHQTSTTCNADANCKWDTSESYPYCAQKPTDAFLATICTVCLARFAQAMGGMATQFQTVMCAKEGNTFCFNPVMNSLDSGMSSAVLEPMCASATDKSCFRKVIGAVAAGEMKDNMDKLENCMEAYSTTPSDSPSTIQMRLRSTEQCIERSNIKMTKSMLALSRNICNKNAAGSLCIPMMKQHENNTCIRTLSMQHSCNQTCSDELKTFADTIGCCMGTLQETFSPALTQEDLPRLRGVNNSFAFPVVRQNKTAVTVGAGERFIPHVGDGTVSSFGLCTSLNGTIDHTMHLGCSATLSAKVIKRSITIPASFNRINSNPELKRNVLTAMVKDVATTLGVPEDYIQNPQIVEDKSRYVSVSAGRRMSSLATETAAKLEFDLQSESDAETTQYIETFDALATSNEIQLTQTDVVLQVQCEDCKAEGATTLNSDVYVAPENAESGATLSSVVVAIMATFMAVVCVL